MTDLKLREIIKDIRETIARVAKENGCFRFYDMHQKGVIKFAEKLLKMHEKADKGTVLIACWLHDVAYYYAKNKEEAVKIRKDHHLKSAEIAGQVLRKYGFEQAETSRILDCILRHRNIVPYKSKTLEEKIVAVADTLSHYSNQSFRRMVVNNLAELKKDWHDFQLLPGASKLIGVKYKDLKKLLKKRAK